MMASWTEEELANKLKENPDVKVEAPRVITQKGLLSPKKPSKMRNKRTNYNGRNYPSKKQATDAAKFQSLVGAGKPYKAYLQEVPFALPGLTPTGRPIVHRVDHLLLTWDDKAEWYETKCNPMAGRAKMGELKRSQTEQLYNIIITIV